MTNDIQLKVFECFGLVDEIEDDQTICDYIDIVGLCNKFCFNYIDIYLINKNSKFVWVIDFMSDDKNISFKFYGNIPEEKFSKFINPLVEYLGRNANTLH